MPEQNAPGFGATVRQLRNQRGWSLRDLAERIRFNRGYIGKVEQGEKFPDRQFAELSERAFSANGELLAIWQVEAEARQRVEKVGRLLTASVEDSVRLIASIEERLSLGEIDVAMRHLAVAYLGTPPAPMLMETVALRSQVLRRLRDHNYRPHELADLYVMLGRIQGVLAYAALDLGDADGAMTHATAAWRCAEHAGDNELHAWVRGTQSLIARFQGDYAHALGFVEDGLHYPSSGTSRIRLLCGVAQCHANLGNSPGTNKALDLSWIEREKGTTPDPVAGLFEFSRAKQHYYAGSSLIWLPNEADATRATQETTEAIDIWQREPSGSRSLDDEALAHIYLGTAQLRLGNLASAGAAIRPILELPPERQISWIKKRLMRLAHMLRSGRYADSTDARSLHDEIHAIAA
ncbi:MAG TPA: helix-turn-helix transcriptional regulator [Micromonosporaceae bacterium]